MNVIYQKNGGITMKTKRIFSMITMLAVLLSLSTTTFAVYGYEENVSPPADNVSQIIGDGNTVVFIDVPLKEIKRRVTNLSTRGIAFHSGDTLDDVFDERVPLYEKYADVKVVFENATDIENTVDKIYEKIKSLL